MSKNTIESSERTEIFAVRDSETGQIIRYVFQIYKRDRDPFIGSLDRKEMEFIMHNYCNNGAKLTQKQVAREFPQYTFNQVRDIIRAFNITKADVPLAPHEREELNEEEQYQKILRIQENAVVKRLEANEIKNVENRFYKVASENYQLKKQLEELENISASINVEDMPEWEVKKPLVDSKDVYIWLSDMHIGAWINAEESLYGISYNEDVVTYRLQKIFDIITGLSNVGSIYICNLGDSLDGMDQQTTRRDHILPQNMSNNQQLEVFVKCMTTFFVRLRSHMSCPIYYYCVGDSNHDGCFGRAANRILQVQLQSINVKAVIFNRFMDYFKSRDIAVIMCHGKDSRDMKKPMPITINPQTEVKINEFINIYGVKGKKILFVKGDSHTSATTYGSNFIYKSVGAFVGSTKWSAANFGNTLPICDYSIIDGDGNILDGQIDLR